MACQSVNSPCRPHVADQLGQLGQLASQSIPSILDLMAGRFLHPLDLYYTAIFRLALPVNGGTYIHYY